jgi:hypothetical protein
MGILDNFEAYLELDMADSHECKDCKCKVVDQDYTI